jgi:hypothetical protein
LAKYMGIWQIKSKKYGLHTLEQTILTLYFITQPTATRARSCEH